MPADIHDIENKKVGGDVFYRRVGQNLRRLRKQHKYTQEFLSRVLGRKSYHVYGKIENGEVRLNLEDAMILCRLYNVPIEDLLNSESKPFSSRTASGREVQMLVTVDSSKVSLLKQINLLKNIQQALFNEYI